MQITRLVRQGTDKMRKRRKDKENCQPKTHAVGHKSVKGTKGGAQVHQKRVREPLIKAKKDNLRSAKTKDPSTIKDRKPESNECKKR